MKTARVYGTKNGSEKVIFAMLALTPECIKRAKKTARQNGYEITKATSHGTAETRYAESDVTNLFMD